MNWVCVEDGLPTFGVKVFITTGGNQIMKGMVAKGFTKNAEWVPVWFSEGHMVCGVTKWCLIK